MVRLFCWQSKDSKKNIKDHLEDVICRCIDIKRQIVENDEFDKGERMLLNFGHTLGHAIEKIQNFNGLSHGSAVSVGMCIITELAIKQGLCSEDTYISLKKCLKKYNLPLTFFLIISPFKMRVIKVYKIKRF